MDNWNPSIVYDMAIERHREDIGRGTTAQRMASQRSARAPRARLAAALVTVAARLDPAQRVPERQVPAPVTV